MDIEVTHLSECGEIGFPTSQICKFRIRYPILSAII